MYLRPLAFCGRLDLACFHLFHNSKFLCTEVVYGAVTMSGLHLEITLELSIALDIHTSGTAYAIVISYKLGNGSASAVGR
jgi:hypothetical protein